MLNAEAASYLDAEFRNTKKDTNTSMKSHLKLMREMADKLHASGETVSNLDFATVIFNSLGPEYREIKRIVLDEPVNQFTYTNIRKALIVEELRLTSGEEGNQVNQNLCSLQDTRISTNNIIDNLHITPTRSKGNNPFANSTAKEAIGQTNAGRSKELQL